MIDKQDFYHGAAIIRLLEDSRLEKLRRWESGYLVNESAFALVKYRTNSRSPWIFTFIQDETEKLNSLAESIKMVVLALVCGGDGICALSWPEARELLEGETGSISVRRKFNERYGVTGASGKLRGKISLKEWPLILFRD